jgi:hypothetical protein
MVEQLKVLHYARNPIVKFLKETMKTSHINVCGTFFINDFCSTCQTDFSPISKEYDLPGQAIYPSWSIS